MQVESRAAVAALGTRSNASTGAVGPSTQTPAWVIAYAAGTDAALGRHGIAEVLETARGLGSPDRTTVVVRDAERPWWSVLTVALREEQVLAEPFERGSATGALAALLAARLTPETRVWIVFGAVAPEYLRAAQDAARADDDEMQCFRLDTRLRLPVAVASAETWRRRIEAVDGARVSALDMAIERAASPSEALDELYPFLTALEMERDVLSEDAGALRTIRVDRPAPTADRRAHHASM